MPGGFFFSLSLVFQIQPAEIHRLTLDGVCSPGRWMASALMKLAFAHILSHYDILLPDLSSGPLTGSLSFEEFYVPNFGLKITLRQRR